MNLSDGLSWPHPENWHTSALPREIIGESVGRKQNQIPRTSQSSLRYVRSFNEPEGLVSCHLLYKRAINLQQIMSTW